MAKAMGRLCPKLKGLRTKPESSGAINGTDRQRAELPELNKSVSKLCVVRVGGTASDQLMTAIAPSGCGYVARPSCHRWQEASHPKKAMEGRTTKDYWLAVSPEPRD